MATARIALVTGGMGGLGEAICVKLAALGFSVVTTHSPGNTKAAEWLESMKRQGHSFRAYPCDVASFDSAAACVKQVVGVKIDPEALDKEDLSMLEDLIVAAVNEAGRKVEETMQGKMGAMASSLPGLF